MSFGGREDMSSSRPRGFTLIEILFVIALWAVIAGIAAPQVLVALDRQKAWAAARYLTARMTMARSYAVTRSAYVALRFTRLGDDVMFQMFVDGNRNGVRTLDIGSHVDSAMGASTRLSELFPGWSSASPLTRAQILSGRVHQPAFLQPLGTATPGTIYVRSHDGLQLAIRITGATGRTRLLRYVPHTREWVGSF